MRAVHLPKDENVRLLGARGRSVVTLSPKIFGEKQYGLNNSVRGRREHPRQRPHAQLRMGPTCRLSWWCSRSPREDPRHGHWPRPRARTPLPTGTSSHSRGASAPCSPPTPATTRVHGCDDTHDTTNVKYYSLRSCKNKMNRRKLHDCCKTFVRGCLLALCGAWRAAVRQSAASHRSYIGPGVPMCKQEARPCFTHRSTACPCGACHAAELPEYRATWASRTWRAPTSASLTLTCAPVRVPSKRLHAHTGPDRQNQPRPSILSPPISLLARALHARALHARVPMQAATLTVPSRSCRSQNLACRF